jgi:hypothetical protein
MEENINMAPEQNVRFTITQFVKQTFYGLRNINTVTAKRFASTGSFQDICS